MVEDANNAQHSFNRLLVAVEQVVRGKRDRIALALACIFAEGHLLVEDVPGTGKTTLAKAIAASIDGSMNRIQFTPDMLPSDVTGGMIYNQGTHEFEPYLGPIFTNIVLADEINRASPKTQAALLEVMEERQVTLGNETMAVPRPFMVIATQNPVEQEGTYRLPEAQLDRFMMRIDLGYASKADTMEMLRGNAAGVRPEDLEPVLTTDDVQAMIQAVQQVHVDDAIYEHIIDLVEASRKLSEVRLGASPRATIALARSSRAVAAAQGREFVTADDVRRVAPYVLGHRLLLTPDAELKGVGTDDLVDRLLDSVAPPPIATRE